MTPLVAIRSSPSMTGAPTSRSDLVSSGEGFRDEYFVVDGDVGTSLSVGADFVVVVIGRIDELPAHPLGRLTRPVSEHLLDGWRRMGTDVLRGAVGDFSVLCYDRRSTDVFAFRDIAGAIPIYLVGGRHLVVTTTLASALREAEQVTVDRTWTRAYLAGRWPEADRTPYAEIALLPPGHLAVAADREWRTRRLDDWQWADDVSEDISESAERFRSLFDDAVRRRLVDADGGTAVTTSGGLDSSSVLVTARAVSPDRPLTALALAFTDRRGDERVYQEAVARAAGARLAWIPADEAGGPFGDGPQELLRMHSGPPLIGNWFLHAAARRRAEELGIARVLDGEDGDGVLGGSPLYLADLLGRGRLVAWAGETLAWCSANGADVRRTARRSIREVRRAVRTGRRGNVYQPSVRALVDGGYLSNITAAAHQIWSALPGGVFHPFLDRRVVEYALSLPTAQRVRRGRSKVLLRQAMAGRLPPIVADRPGKANISHPFVSALQGAQRSILHEGLALATTQLRDFNTETVPALNEHMSASDMYRAYRFACVAFWLSDHR